MKPINKNIPTWATMILNSPMKVLGKGWMYETLYKLAEELEQLSPAPAATVTGWRLLEVGEKLQDGDEWLDEATGEWEPNLYPQDKLLVDAKVRRRLTPPALTDEMRALVKACQPFLKHSMWPYPNEVDALSSAIYAVAAVRGAGGEGE